MDATFLELIAYRGHLWRPAEIRSSAASSGRPASSQAMTASMVIAAITWAARLLAPSPYGRLPADSACWHPRRMPSDSFRFAQATTTRDVDPDRRQALIDCWVDVSNAGGAAGFPFPPIDQRDAAPALDAILGNLAPQTCRILMALDGDDLVGWLNIRRDAFALIAHWGTLHHVQTRTDRRGQGIGVALMKKAHAVARDQMGLEQLHLAARAGVGLETFYERLGWKEIGRWPGALRLGPGDDRDEVLMLLELGAEEMTRP